MFIFTYENAKNPVLIPIKTGLFIYAIIVTTIIIVVIIKQLSLDKFSESPL